MAFKINTVDGEIQIRDYSQPEHLTLVAVIPLTDDEEHNTKILAPFAERIAQLDDFVLLHKEQFKEMKARLDAWERMTAGESDALIDSLRKSEGL